MSKEQEELTKTLAETKETLAAMQQQFAEMQEKNNLPDEPVNEVTQMDLEKNKQPLNFNKQPTSQSATYRPEVQELTIQEKLEKHDKVKKGFEDFIVELNREIAQAEGFNKDPMNDMEQRASAKRQAEVYKWFIQRINIIFN